MPAGSISTGSATASSDAIRGVALAADLRHNAWVGARGAASNEGDATMRNQRGVTLIGFVVILALVGVLAYLGMKVFPIYEQFFSVRSAMKGVSSEPGVAQMDPAKIKDLFFRRLYVNYADEDLKPENIKIERKDNGYTMTVNYEVRRPLIADLDIVGKFNETQALVGGGSTDE